MAIQKTLAFLALLVIAAGNVSAQGFNTSLPGMETSVPQIGAPVVPITGHNINWQRYPGGGCWESFCQSCGHRDCECRPSLLQALNPFAIFSGRSSILNLVWSRCKYCQGKGCQQSKYHGHGHDHGHHNHNHDPVRVPTPVPAQNHQQVLPPSVPASPYYGPGQAQPPRYHDDGSRGHRVPPVQVDPLRSEQNTNQGNRHQAPNANQQTPNGGTDDRGTQQDDRQGGGMPNERVRPNEIPHVEAREIPERGTTGPRPRRLQSNNPAPTVVEEKPPVIEGSTPRRSPRKKPAANQPTPQNTIPTLPQTSVPVNEIPKAKKKANQETPNTPPRVVPVPVPARPNSQPESENPGENLDRMSLRHYIFAR